MKQRESIDTFMKTVFTKSFTNQTLQKQHATRAASTQFVHCLEALDCVTLQIHHRTIESSDSEMLEKSRLLIHFSQGISGQPRLDENLCNSTYDKLGTFHDLIIVQSFTVCFFCIKTCIQIIGINCLFPMLPGNYKYFSKWAILCQSQNLIE